MSDFKISEGPNQDLNTILKVASFCIPLLGGILWFIKKDEEPVTAKAAGMFALYGMGFYIALNILSVVLGAMF